MKKLLAAIYPHLALGLQRSLVRCLAPARPGRMDLARIQSVLVYGTMGLGNMLLFTPVLRSLRRGLPQARVTLVVGEARVDQLLCGSGLMDEVLRLGPSRTDLLRLAWQVRQRRFDLLLSSFHGDGLAVATALSGIPLRVGHARGPDWDSGLAAAYHLAVPMESEDHEVDRGLRLVRALDLEADPDPPWLAVPAENQRRAQDFLTAHDLTGPAPLVGVQADTWKQQLWKRWDPRRLAAVCDRLVEAVGARILVLGSPANKDQVEQLRAALTVPHVSGVGQLTLLDTAGVLQQCQLTLCNDSGLMHVSAAVGTPVVAIFGPTDHRRTSPLRYAARSIVLRRELPCSPCLAMFDDRVPAACPHRRCLTEITVDEVVRAAVSLLASATPADSGHTP